MRRAPLLVTLFLVLSACAADEVLELPEANPEARSGGTLRIGTTTPPALDPGIADALDPSSFVVRTMCDTLVDLDPRTGEVRPAIASSVQVLDGGQRVVVRLRRGVLFHDGRELQADDVVWSLSRIARQDYASPVASILEPVHGYGMTHGDEEAADDHDREHLRGLWVIEPYSFEIHLADPRADFVRALAHPATAPVSRAAAEADPSGFVQRPVCAGPYELAEPWTAEEGGPIRLRRFAEYHGSNTAHTAGGAGYPDEIEFVPYGTTDEQLMAFTDGRIDVAHLPTEAVEEVRTGGERVVTTVTPTLEYIGLPVSAAPFDVRGVRVAFSQALDRRRIAEEVYAGLRSPASSFLPPAAGEVHRADACGPRAPATGDVEGARRTLREAGVDLRGERVQLLYNDEFDHAELVEAVALQWEEAFGVTVELVGMPWDRYLEQGLSPSGFPAPFRMSWAPQYPTPDTYLEPLFDPESVGRQNFTRFTDTTFRNLLTREARRASADEDLLEAYRELEVLVCGEMPAIPLTFGTRSYLLRESAVGGAVDDPTSVSTGMLAVRELYLRNP